MRRAEMARRRKNLSEKRNEEEKVRISSCALSLPYFSYLFLHNINHSPTTPTGYPNNPSTTPSY